MSHSHHSHRSSRYSVSQPHAKSHDAHTPKNFDRSFALGIVLNLLFVGVEGYFGWWADSLALLADAGHNLSDVAGLVLAWAALWVGRRHASPRYTYGWKRAGILAAFANAMLLLFAIGMLASEAIQRLMNPSPLQGEVMMAVATVGIVINAATAWLFMRDSGHDLNLRGAFLHMAADALVSVGVVVAGALAWWKGWRWIDPVVSLLVVAAIVWGTWGLLSQSVHLLFDGVPSHLDWHQVRASLLELPGVEQVQDLHIWAMGTSQVALTAHLVVPQGINNDTFYAQARHMLHERFEIDHITLQVMRHQEPPTADGHLSV